MMTKQGLESVSHVHCFKKLSSLSKLCFYPDRLLQFDTTLQKSIRLCDTREYLDTMTVASNLLEDGEKFLQLMQVVTRGNFLKDPCKGTPIL